MRVVGIDLNFFLILLSESITCHKEGRRKQNLKGNNNNETKKCSKV